MEGRSRGHFVVDLAQPGHLTSRLRAFQAAIGASEDSWDASFAEAWTTADFVDCIVSYVATALALEMTDPCSVEGADMVHRAAADPRVARQALLLMHLYADCDASTLRALRGSLLRRRLPSAAAFAGGAAVVASGVGVGVALHHNPDMAEWALDEIDAAAPLLTAHPKISLALLAAAVTGGSWAVARARRLRSLARARAVAAPVRVVKRRPEGDLARVIDATFSVADGPEEVRGMCIGISAQQKLDKLSSLLRVLGYESLAVFGDCFDEVSLLDPVAYPSAIKVFAREACRNDLLNAGRLHLFFPDSRLALDLNTDRTLKEVIAKGCV